ncbi:MAG: hypothetical protein ABSF18_06025, partial [Gammaproteobacteria bacterium]
APEQATQYFDVTKAENQTVKQVENEKKTFIKLVKLNHAALAYQAEFQVELTEKKKHTPTAKASGINFDEVEIAITWNKQQINAEERDKLIQQLIEIQNQYVETYFSLQSAIKIDDIVAYIEETEVNSQQFCKQFYLKPCLERDKEFVIVNNLYFHARNQIATATSGMIVHNIARKTKSGAIKLNLDYSTESPDNFNRLSTTELELIEALANQWADNKDDKNNKLALEAYAIVEKLANRGYIEPQEFETLKRFYQAAKTLRTDIDANAAFVLGRAETKLIHGINAYTNASDEYISTLLSASFAALFKKLQNKFEDYNKVLLSSTHSPSEKLKLARLYLYNLDQAVPRMLIASFDSIIDKSTMALETFIFYQNNQYSVSKILKGEHNDVPLFKSIYNVYQQISQGIKNNLIVLLNNHIDTLNQRFDDYSKILSENTEENAGLNLNIKNLIKDLRELASLIAYYSEILPQDVIKNFKPLKVANRTFNIDEAHYALRYVLTNVYRQVESEIDKYYEQNISIDNKTIMPYVSKIKSFVDTLRNDFKYSDHLISFERAIAIQNEKIHMLLMAKINVFFYSLSHVNSNQVISQLETIISEHKKMGDICTKLGIQWMSNDQFHFQILKALVGNQVEKQSLLDNHDVLNRLNTLIELAPSSLSNSLNKKILDFNHAVVLTTELDLSRLYNDTNNTLTETDIEATKHIIMQNPQIIMINFGLFKFTDNASESLRNLILMHAHITVTTSDDKVITNSNRVQFNVEKINGLNHIHRKKAERNHLRQDVTHFFTRKFVFKNDDKLLKKLKQVRMNPLGVHFATEELEHFNDLSVYLFDTGEVGADYAAKMYEKLHMLKYDSGSQLDWLKRAQGSSGFVKNFITHFRHGNNTSSVPADFIIAILDTIKNNSELLWHEDCYHIYHIIHRQLDENQFRVFLTGYMMALRMSDQRNSQKATMQFYTVLNHADAKKFQKVITEELSQSTFLANIYSAANNHYIAPNVNQTICLALQTAFESSKFDKPAQFINQLKIILRNNFKVSQLAFDNAVDYYLEQVFKTDIEGVALAKEMLTYARSHNLKESTSLVAVTTQKTKDNAPLLVRKGTQRNFAKASTPDALQSKSEELQSIFTYFLNKNITMLDDASLSKHIIKQHKKLRVIIRMIEQLEKVSDSNLNERAKIYDAAISEIKAIQVIFVRDSGLTENILNL